MPVLPPRFGRQFGMQRARGVKNRCATFTTFTRPFVFMEISGEYRVFPHVHRRSPRSPLKQFRVSCFQFQKPVRAKATCGTSKKLPREVHEVHWPFVFKWLGGELLTFPHVHEVHDVHEVHGTERSECSQPSPEPALSSKHSAFSFRMDVRTKSILRIFRELSPSIFENVHNVHDVHSMFIFSSLQASIREPMFTQCSQRALFNDIQASHLKSLFIQVVKERIPFHQRPQKRHSLGTPGIPLPPGRFRPNFRKSGVSFGTPAVGQPLVD